MEGNRKQVEGKALGFAYEFDKEGRRRMVDIFPSSLAFHWDPGPATQFVGASEKPKCGTQKCGTPCSRNTRHFKTGRAEVGSLLSVGLFGQ